MKNVYNEQKPQTWKIVPAEYKVRYRGNGGTGTPSDQIKYYKGKLVLSKNLPTRRGYIFTGWNTSADGTGVSYKPGDVYNIDKDIVLYAQRKGTSFVIVNE